VYGDHEEVMRLLGVDSGGKINTAYVCQWQSKNPQLWQ